MDKTTATKEALYNNIDSKTRGLRYTSIRYL